MQDGIRTQPAPCWSAYHYVFFSVVLWRRNTDLFEESVP